MGWLTNGAFLLLVAVIIVALSPNTDQAINEVEHAHLSLRNTVDMGGNRITNLATPQADTDAATKLYVEKYANKHDDVGNSPGQLAPLLAAGNSAGGNNIDMNGDDLRNVSGIHTQFAKGSIVFAGDNGELNGTNKYLFWNDSSHQLQLLKNNTGEVFPLRLRNEAGPDTNNKVGTLLELKNDAEEFVEYGRLEARSEDTTTGSEDGAVQIDVIRNGQLEEAALFNTQEIIFKDGGINRDFRVENSADSAAFFVMVQRCRWDWGRTTRPPG